jgi:hypothetical protein
MQGLISEEEEIPNPLSLGTGMSKRNHYRKPFRNRICHYFVIKTQCIIPQRLTKFAMLSAQGVFAEAGDD